MNYLSKTPYLLRAFYDWIIDNQWDPYIVLDATDPKTDVPQEFVQHGQIILNISPKAIRDLAITQKDIYFRSSFSGQVREVHAPMRAVISIYAKETGEGINFDPEDIDIEKDSDNGTIGDISSDFKVIK